MSHVCSTAVEVPCVCPSRVAAVSRYNLFSHATLHVSFIGADVTTVGGASCDASDQPHPTTERNHPTRSANRIMERGCWRRVLTGVGVLGVGCAAAAAYSWHELQRRCDIFWLPRATQLEHLEHATCMGGRDSASFHTSTYGFWAHARARAGAPRAHTLSYKPQARTEP